MSEASETLKKVEYRVAPVTRYTIIRYEEGEDPAIEVGPNSWKGTSQHGEFDNIEIAYEVGYALAGAEHQRLGWPVGDDRMQYPRGDARYPGLNPVAEPA